MFGVVFDGHPDLRRILMPEDYEGYPAAARLPDGRRAGAVHVQRAQATRAGMTDPPIRADDASARRALPRARALGDDGRRSATSEPTTSSSRSTSARTTPPRTGCCACCTTLEGEIVRDVKPIIGYVHTGIEKSCEDQQYWKVITFVERMDYLAYYFNAMAFCMAVESAARRGGAAARAVAARDPPGAEPDRLATCSGSPPARSTSARSRCSGGAAASATSCSTCSRCRAASASTRATSRSAA